MNDSTENTAPKPLDEKPEAAPEGEEARAALVERLSHLFRAPVQTKKQPRSLQPTPEAAQSRLARLRRKERMLIQKTKRAETARSSIPPAPDPLAP